MENNKCTKLDYFCYVCGHIVPKVDKKDRKNLFTEEFKTAYCHYFDEADLSAANFTPNTVCKNCYNTLIMWIHAKGGQFSFMKPVIWVEDLTGHHKSRCYACINYRPGLNRKQLKSKVYIAAFTATLPVKRTADTDTPKPPSLDAVSLQAETVFTNPTNVNDADWTHDIEINVPQPLTQMCSDGDRSDSPTPVTVPKKRGRPSKPNKVVKKVMPPSGRGRGRPKSLKSTAAADGSADEEGTASDGGSPFPNGDSTDVVSSGLGRPRKVGKPKINHVIEATGKGRGRPKKPLKGDSADGNEDKDDDNDGESVDYKPYKRDAKKAPKKGRGRPKKSQNSDDESSDDKMDEDDEERRSVGRPASGGVNLNIARTGRGQGRPKKEVAVKRAGDSENGSDSPKKRGRPNVTGKGAAYAPTGKPRGRPKTAVDKESQDEEDDEDEEEKPSAELSAGDDEEECKVQSDSEDAA